MKVKVTKAPRYTFIFNDKAAGWTKDETMNKMFLLQQQNYANEKLKARGYLFLNDILDMVGLPRTKAGQVVGWIYDPSNININSFVDFGFNHDYSPKTINGGILLNFNADGNIWDKF